jgi:hypothetical protein
MKKLEVEEKVYMMLEQRAAAKNMSVEDYVTSLIVEKTS